MASRCSFKNLLLSYGILLSAENRYYDSSSDSNEDIVAPVQTPTSTATAASRYYVCVIPASFIFCLVNKIGQPEFPPFRLRAYIDLLKQHVCLALILDAVA